MRLLAVLVLVLMLGGAVVAIPEAIVMGAYKVSFDMGRNVPLDWNVTGPIESETLDGISYTEFSAESMVDYPLTIRITVRSTNETGPLNQTEINNAKNNIAGLLKNCIDERIVDRVIDGTRGVIGAGFDSDANEQFYIACWKDNQTAYDISTYRPWENGTLSLLKTIHVERITP